MPSGLPTATMIVPTSSRVVSTGGLTNLPPSQRPTIVEPVRERMFDSAIVRPASAPAACTRSSETSRRCPRCRTPDTRGLKRWLARDAIAAARTCVGVKAVVAPARNIAARRTGLSTMARMGPLNPW